MQTPPNKVMQRTRRRRAADHRAVRVLLETGRMTQRSPGFLRRLTAEFAVIVVGVFVALWADSYAHARSQRAAQAELLSSLASELESNIVVLDSAAARAGLLVEGMRHLIAIHDQTEPVPSLDSLEVLLGSAISYWRAEQQGLAFGVYDGMIATGTARLLDQREIGERLARHRLALMNGQGDEVLAERALEHIVTIMRRYGGALAFMPGAAITRRGIADRDRERDISALLQDPVFADALFARVVYDGNIVSFYRRQISELGQTLALVKDELGEP